MKRISDNEDEKGKAEMMRVLEEKWYTLQKINKISQELVKEEEKQSEISDSDEYMLELKNKLSRLDNVCFI